MIKVLFICHGNICRSPLAHLYFQDLVKKQGLADKFYVDSAATSYEKIGNPVHPGSRRGSMPAIWRNAIMLNLII